jgi:hypothetical protein
VYVTTGQQDNKTGNLMYVTTGQQDNKTGNLMYVTTGQQDNKTGNLMYVTTGQQGNKTGNLMYVTTGQQDNKTVNLMYERNIGARSCNHCCSGKTICTTYSACVFAALVIQHAKRLCLIILSSVTCLVRPYFSTFI